MVLGPTVGSNVEESGDTNATGLYSVLQNTSPSAARLTGRILSWLMDSGRLEMYSLARKLELEQTV